MPLRRYVKRLPVMILAVLCLSLSCSILYAQDEQALEARNEFDSFIRYIPSRSIEAGSGKAGIINAKSQYSYKLKAFGKLPVKLLINTQYIGIDDTAQVSLPTRLTGLVTGIEATLLFFNIDKTYFRLGLYPSFYGDDWDFDSSDFRMLSNYIFIYKPDEKWTFLTGLALRPDFERRVLPIAGFIYKPNDRLLFNITPDRPGISYRLDDKLILFTEADASFSEFEVKKDELKTAVLQYKEAHIGCGVKYKFNNRMKGSISAGRILNHTLKYRDSLGKVGIKDGLYTEFRLEAKI